MSGKHRDLSDYERQINRSLQAKVLVQAIRDLLVVRRRGSGKRIIYILKEPVYPDEVFAWFAANDSTGPYTFATICAEFNLDMVAVRDAMFHGDPRKIIERIRLYYSVDRDAKPKGMTEDVDHEVQYVEGLPAVMNLVLQERAPVIQAPRVRRVFRRIRPKVQSIFLLVG